MIEGARCPACERASVPGEARCLACRSVTEPASFEPTGRILARTQTDPQAGWIVLVELEEGARVLARRPDEPTIGATARVEARAGTFKVHPEP